MQIFRETKQLIFKDFPAQLYECRCRTVVLQDMSDRTVERALLMGFAPPVAITHCTDCLAECYCRLYQKH